MSDIAFRQKRRHGGVLPDQRAEFERDRDRLLYSSAFHRLAGITQIVRAGDLEIFHTRQQHTMKVAQVGRRLAQRCVKDFPELSDKVGIDPEVVEAACIAHDLGHPPFGHVGEKVLDEMAQSKGDPDGFEGNAQSFRIITKLGVRFSEFLGLDLTRATLSACLKYPWLRNATDPKKATKWSAYSIDKEDFDFARESFVGEFKSAEAALMDWSDDIAYSVHDLEDFHRCGAIPWRDIFEDNGVELIRRALEKWFNPPHQAEELLIEAFQNISDHIYQTYQDELLQKYEATKDQRIAIRQLTSSLVGRYVKAVEIVDEENPVYIDELLQAEVLLLKQITRDYTISNPSLQAQQYGQRKILGNLFNAIHEESEKGFPSILPLKFKYIWDICAGARPRFTADCIASLTEKEAVGMHARLYGLSHDSVLDPIVR